MYPRILHIYGPLWINSYGLMIALGLLVFMYLFTHDKRSTQLLKNVNIADIMLVGTLAGIIGGRILYVLMTPEAFASNWLEIFFPWEGGLSLLGAMLGILFVGAWYLPAHKIPILSFFDLVALYAPLTQAIARIGCFCAGCCYGAQTALTFPFAIRYTHPDSLAPLYVFLHPTQLYSSAASLAIFCVLYFFVQQRVKKSGQLLCAYLILECSARFVVDFWRGDRELEQTFLGISSIAGIISPYQMISLLLGFAALILFFMLNRTKNDTLS